jgi:O-antigen/teichoic acid export membrane protein
MTTRPARRVVPSFERRIAAVIAGELINKASVMFAFVWLARTITQSTYGDVEWATSIMFVAVLVGDAGLTTWGAAEIAARPERARRLRHAIAKLRIRLAAPAYLALLAAGYARSGSAFATVAVYGLTLWITPFLLQHVFNGLYETRWVAVGSAARGLAFLSVVMLFASPESTALVPAIAEVLGAGAMALAHFIGAKRVLELRTDPPVIDSAPVDPILPRSWTIGASELVWGLQWSFGLLWLGYVAPSEGVAWHSAGLRIVAALHTGVYLYLYVLLPTLARLLADRSRDDEWRTTLAESMRLTAWAGFGVALVTVVGAEVILEAAFGAPYVAAATGLRLMIWAVPIAWASGHIRYSLIAMGQPKLDYRSAVAGTATTIMLTIVLVPSLGPTGAAAALVAGILANGLTAWHLGRRYLPATKFVIALLPSVAAMAVAWTIASGLQPLIGIWSAAVAFALFGALAASAAKSRICALLAQTRFSVPPR